MTDEGKVGLDGARGMSVQGLEALELVGAGVARRRSDEAKKG